MTGIFFNADNLKLALPLITLCVVYGFFKFIPLQIGVPLVVFLILGYKFRQSRITAERLAVVNSLEKEGTDNEKAYKMLMEEEERRVFNEKAKKKKKLAKKHNNKTPTLTMTNEESDDEDEEYDLAKISKKIK
ncbi:hypothetical protein TrVE_jg6654 [Triparma verrucosa]|uniref:Uncharacterized protein n=1 Tax=Triparma verrucosa TaxID=1606542 RepID=A0A9W7BZU0_9STRA|nr:hypothetical protein TrVE_jg6654 [Triparma verrucosa]